MITNLRWGMTRPPNAKHLSFLKKLTNKNRHHLRTLTSFHTWMTLTIESLFTHPIPLSLNDSLKGSDSKEWFIQESKIIIYSRTNIMRRVKVDVQIQFQSVSHTKSQFKKLFSDMYIKFTVIQRTKQHIELNVTFWNRKYFLLSVQFEFVRSG